MENKTIRIFDNYKKNSKDVLRAADKTPRGFVEIFSKEADGSLTKIGESDKVTFPEYKGPNMIVYPGRNWLMQRAFNLDYLYGSLMKDRYISWLGLGTGGATPGDPLNPILPEVTDSDLINPILINISDPLVVDGGKLHPFDSIEYDQDIANDNVYLIAKVTTTISADDANGSSGTTYYDLSEAGMYISNSSDPTIFDVLTKILWARVTFSTIRKHNKREIVLIWSIYF